MAIRVLEDKCSGRQLPYSKRGIGGCPRKVITTAGYRAIDGLQVGEIGANRGEGQDTFVRGETGRDFLIEPYAGRARRGVVKSCAQVPPKAREFVAVGR